MASVEGSQGEDKLNELKKVVHLYKGSFLDGFVIRNAPDWEEWVSQKRDNLQQHFLNASVEMGNQFLRENKPSHALHIFQRTLSFVSDFEPAHSGMMRAYAEQELLLLRGSSSQLAESWRLFGEIYTVQGRYDYAQESFNQCRALAKRENNTFELVHCYHKNGVLLHKMGKINEARNMLEEAIEMGLSLPVLSDYLPIVQIELVRVLIDLDERETIENMILQIEDHVLSRPNDWIHNELMKVKELLED